MALPGSVVADGRSLLLDQTILALRRSHQFYLGLTLFLMATVVIGFWPSYFGTLLGGGVTRPLVMHVHGAIFTGWMLLLLLQVGVHRQRTSAVASPCRHLRHLVWRDRLGHGCDRHVRRAGHARSVPASGHWTRPPGS